MARTGTGDLATGSGDIPVANEVVLTHTGDLVPSTPPPAKSSDVPTEVEPSGEGIGAFVTGAAAAAAAAVAAVAARSSSDDDELSSLPTDAGSAADSAFDFDGAFSQPPAEAAAVVPLDDGAERTLPIPEAVADTEIGFDTFVEPDRETSPMSARSQKKVAEATPSLVSGEASVARRRHITRLETLLSRVQSRRRPGADH